MNARSVGRDIFVTWPCDDDEIHRPEDIGGAVPGSNFCKRIGSDDEI